VVCLAVSPPARAATQTFANTSAITIGDSPGGVAQSADPYPSQLAASGLSGTVTGVTATLHGFHHPCPQDVDVLLVGPSGDSALLASDAGDCAEDATRSPIDLTFDDSASSAIPCLTDGTDLPGGTYKPADYPDHDCTTENPDFADSFPAPAPPGPWLPSLGSFVGKNPNGTWSLYVVDDQNGDAGAIDGGWSLAVTTQALVEVPAAPPPFHFATKTRLVQRVLKAHGVLVRFDSNTGGNLVAGGTVSVPGAAKTYRLATVKRHVAAGTVQVKLRLRRSALADARRALTRHRKLSAKVTTTLTAPDGRETTKKLTIRLR
jgi:hypothetical protein